MARHEAALADRQAQRLAREVWPKGERVGSRASCSDYPKGKVTEIVGVVADVAPGGPGHRRPDSPGSTCRRAKPRRVGRGWHLGRIELPLPESAGVSSARQRERSNPNLPPFYDLEPARRPSRRSGAGRNKRPLLAAARAP